MKKIDKQEKAREEGITEQLQKLEEIVRWLESQEEVDVEQGLEKVREGGALVKQLKDRLKEVENEFEEIAKEE